MTYRHVYGTDDVYECIDCGARKLPGVFEDDHEPSCDFAPEPADEDWGRVSTILMNENHVDGNPS